MAKTIQAIENLRSSSQASGSDRLILSKQGEVLIDESSGRVAGPIELMSVTKSFMAIAVGLLLKQKLISSIDTPLSEFFPEWKEGLKQEVRLRHILNNTSGLKSGRTTEEIYNSSNFLQLALSSEVVQKPGTHFFYNNKAAQIFSGVIENATGKRLDHFMNEAFFKPLGITEWSWELDRAGNPHAFAGLSLLGSDLLKVGTLLLNDGNFQGRSFFNAGWVREMFQQGQPFDPTCGLLWWRDSLDKYFYFDQSLVSEYAAAGLSQETCQKLLSLQKLSPLAEFRKILDNTLGSKTAGNDFISFANGNMLETKRIKMDVPQAFSATGYLGQYLMIVPEKKIVAVRQMDHSSVTNHDAAEFVEFKKLVLEID